ncbi:hypothetical protein Tco_1288838, partial [Tanacetum coccineum]
MGLAANQWEICVSKRFDRAEIVRILAGQLITFAAMADNQISDFINAIGCVLLGWDDAESGRMVEIYGANVVASSSSGRISNADVIGTE